MMTLGIISFILFNAEKEALLTVPSFISRSPAGLLDFAKYRKHKPVWRKKPKALSVQIVPTKSTQEQFTVAVANVSDQFLKMLSFAVLLSPPMSSITIEYKI